MRWLLATALSAITVTAYGQANEAEKLFRGMEMKVRAAKSLKMVCELQGTLDEGGEQIRVKASQQFADANKARFELSTERGGNTTKSLFVSDGKQMVLRDSGPGTEPKPADPHLNEGLPAAIARGGFMLPRLVVNPGKGRFDADKLLKISNFKLGRKEQVGKVEAQAIEHSIAFGGISAAFGGCKTVKVTVWIDPKTLVPLKRKVAAEDQKGTFFIEVYTEFVIDSKLDAELFELPK